MSERTFVDYVLRGMKPYGHFTKHADAFTPGIADLSFRIAGVNGWCELKNASKVPARAPWQLRLDHELSAAQATFLLERDGKLLLRIQPLRAYVGLDSQQAMQLWREDGKWPLQRWLDTGRVWNHSIDFQELSQWLTSIAKN